MTSGPIDQAAAGEAIESPVEREAVETIKPRRIAECGWAMFQGDRKVFPAGAEAWYPRRAAVLAAYEASL